MVWYSHLFKSFPQFVTIHTVKDFTIAVETEIGVFLEFPGFPYVPANIGNLISASSSLSKPSLDIWKFLVHIMLNPSMQDISMTLLAWEMSAIVRWLAHSLARPFLGIGMRIDLFQSCGHCWIFQICWHVECSTLTASSFRISNSTTGIPSSPLALFIVILSKAFPLDFTLQDVWL